MIKSVILTALLGIVSTLGIYSNSVIPHATQYFTAQYSNIESKSNSSIYYKADWHHPCDLCKEKSISVIRIADLYANHFLISISDYNYPTYMSMYGDIVSGDMRTSRLMNRKEYTYKKHVLISFC